MKESMNTMLVASSALSVCAETMDHSTGPDLSYAKFSLFHMFEVGFWSKVPYFGDPHPMLMVKRD